LGGRNRLKSKKRQAIEAFPFSDPMLEKRLRKFEQRLLVAFAVTPASAGPAAAKLEKFLGNRPEARAHASPAAL